LNEGYDRTDGGYSQTLAKIVSLMKREMLLETLAEGNMRRRKRRRRAGSHGDEMNLSRKLKLKKRIRRMPTLAARQRIKLALPTPRRTREYLWCERVVLLPQDARRISLESSCGALQFPGRHPFSLQMREGREGDYEETWTVTFYPQRATERMEEVRLCEEEGRKLFFFTSLFLVLSYRHCNESDESRTAEDAGHNLVNLRYLHRLQPAAVDQLLGNRG